MKKILASALVVTFAAASLIGGTKAFFSDTETTDDNTFVAGSLDLTVDFYDEYYGADYFETGNPTITEWAAQDLTSSETFFDLADVVPGDRGTGHISLHTDNAAWARVNFSDVHNNENGCTEPESMVDTTTGCATPGEGQGDLAQNMNVMFWMELSATPNGTYDAGTDVMLTSGVASDITGGLTLEIPSGIPAGATYIGYSWEVPTTVDNIIQSDSFTFDVAFDIQQQRHNPTPVWN